MNLEIFFPDKQFKFDPFPEFNLSLQNCTQRVYTASECGVNENEMSIASARESLAFMKTITSIGSYLTSPNLLISIGLICLTIECLNPFMYSIFAIIRITTTIFALIAITKYTSDGTLPKFSQHLYDYSEKAKDYLEKIDSGKFDKVVFYKLPLIPENIRLSNMIINPVTAWNKFVSKVDSLRVNLKEHLAN